MRKLIRVLGRTDNLMDTRKVPMGLLPLEAFILNKINEKVVQGSRSYRRYEKKAG